MQELHFGHVVKSVAGRDRHRVFVVIGIREKGGGYEATVANGALRTAADAKVKNPRHVKIIAELTESEKRELISELTDEKLREICNKYDNFPKKV